MKKMKKFYSMSEKIELLRQNSLFLKRQIAAQELKIKRIKEEQNESLNRLKKFHCYYCSVTKIKLPFISKITLI